MAKQWVRLTGQIGTGLEGRLLMAAIVVAYLGAVVIARLGFGLDLWPWLGVPSYEFPFVDGLVIASSAECHRLGYDVLVDNPCDPLGRPLNYPRVWLLFAYLGLGLSWAVPFGLAIGALFLLAVWVLVGRLSIGQGVIVAAAVCSPAVMFGVERAQVDLIVFALTVAAIALWRRGGSGTWTSPVLMLGAALAKLFPAFALGAYVLVRHRRTSMTAVGACVVFAGYVAFTLSDIRVIGEVTPQGQHYAYGARIIVAEVARSIDAEAWETLGVARQVVAVLPLLIVGAVAWWRWPTSALLQALTPAVTEGPGDWRRLSFHAGALIYVGTFASANNWDYRLVFLLLCLPQLLAWVQEPRAAQRTMSRAAIVAVLGQVWLGGIAGYHTVIDELWSWGVAILLTVLLVPGARGVWRDRRRLLSGQDPPIVPSAGA